ncbi:MAG TPA: hypothetical protein VGR98_22405 [Streptosporangiaceae bacterium]|nr:hypothetical protein [Streptosporangiaceae bacterium]
MRELGMLRTHACHIGRAVKAFLLQDRVYCRHMFHQWSILLEAFCGEVGGFSVAMPPASDLCFRARDRGLARAGFVSEDHRGLAARGCISVAVNVAQVPVLDTAQSPHERWRARTGTITAMTDGGGSGRPGRRSRRRLLAMLITVILLAMVAGLAAGLVASLAHLKRAPAARRARVHAGSHNRSPKRANRA